MTQLSPTALEEAAKAIYETWARNRSIDETWFGVCHVQHPIANEARQEATAAITAYLAQREKEGWVMVPKEPTKEMIYDGNTTIDDCIDFWNYDSGSGYCVEPHAAAACYRTMLSAASQEQNDA